MNTNTHLRPSQKSKKLVSIGKASRILGVSIDTLRNWDKSGKLKAIRSGARGTRKYNTAKLYDFIRKSHSDAKTKSMFKHIPIKIEKKEFQPQIIQPQADPEYPLFKHLKILVHSFIPTKFPNFVKVWAGATILTFVITSIFLVIYFFRPQAYQEWYTQSFKPISAPFAYLAQASIQQYDTDLSSKAINVLGVNNSRNSTTDSSQISVETNQAKITIPGTSVLFNDLIVDEDVFVGENVQIQGDLILRESAFFGLGPDQIQIKNGTIRSVSQLKLDAKHSIEVAKDVVPSESSILNLGSEVFPFQNIFGSFLSAQSSNLPETTSNSFTIDSDNSKGVISLVFGKKNNERLYWNPSDTKFYFTDDVNINDNLFVGGTVEADQLTDGTVYIKDGTLEWDGNSIWDGNFDGGWSFNGGNLSSVGTIHSGAVLSSGSSTFENITVFGSSTNNGNVTLGSDGGDSITFNGEVVGDLIPKLDATYNLGTSTNQWKNIFLSGTTSINGVSYTWPSADGTSGYSLKTDGSGGLYWDTVAAAASDLQGAYEGGNSIQLSASEGDIRFYSDGGAELLFLDEDAGRVGIGTTAPNDLLELLSTADAQLRLAYDTSNYHALQVAIDGGLTWSTLGTDADLNFDFSGATDGDFSVNTNDLFVDTSTSNVGIGTTSPSSALDVIGGLEVSGTPIFTGIASGGSNTTVLALDGSNNVDYLDISGYDTNGSDDLSYSLTAGYVPYANTTTSLANSGIYFDGTNVGIGTTGPAYNLQTYGSGAFGKADTTNATPLTLLDNGEVLSFGRNGGSQWRIAGGSEDFEIWAGNNISGGSGGSYDLSLGATGDIYIGASKAYTGSIAQADNLYFYTSGSERMRVDTNGNVGIGTTSPSSLLSLGDTTYTFADSGLSFGDGDTGFYEQSDDVLNLRTAGSDRVTVLANGNVGIGTTGPSGNLEVTDSADVNTYFTSGGTGSDVNLYLISKRGSGADSNGRIAYQGLLSDFIIYTGSSSDGSETERLRIDWNNNISLAGDTNTYWSHPAADTLAWTTGGSERMRIDTNGNVGIGTTGPTHLLDVNGLSRFSDDLELDADLLDINDSEGTAGQVLSSLGAGSGVDWIDAVTDTNTNIYNTDGSLTGNRTVTMGSYTLNFAGSTTGDFSVNSDDLFVDTSTGYVGIGTTSPGAKLNVLDTTYTTSGDKIASFRAGADYPLNITSLGGGVRTGIRELYLGGENYNWVGTIGSTGSSGNETLGIRNNRIGGVQFYNSTNNATVTIDNSGNVGIGTTGPTHLLDVNGLSRFSDDLELDADLLDINDSEGTAGQVLSSLGAGSGVDWIDAVTDTNTNIYNTDGSLTGNRTVTLGSYTLNFTGSTTGDFSVNSDDLFVDTSTGYVGIGTTAPTQQLFVQGTGSFAFETGGSPSIQVTGTSGTPTGIIEYASGGLDRWTFAENVVVGNSSNNFPMLIAEITSATNPVFGFRDDDNTGLGSANADTLSLIAGGTNIGNVTTTGLGIGTTGPTHLLDVNGLSRFSDDLELDADLLDINDSEGTAGQVLSSLGAGNGVDWIDAVTDTNTNIYNTDGSLTGNRTVTLGSYTLNFAGSTTGDFSVNSDGLFVDTSTGRVGIGTSSPSYGFEYYNNSKAGYHLRSDSSNYLLSSGNTTTLAAYSGITLTGPTNGDGPILIQSGATSGNNVTLNTQYNAGYDVYGDLLFQINEVEKMRVDGDTGYVGIGTTEPNHELEVNGIIQLTNASDAIYFGPTQGGSQPLIKPGLMNRMMDNSSKIFVIASANGNPSNGSFLRMYGNTGTGTAGDFQFYPGYYAAGSMYGDFEVYTGASATLSFIVEDTGNVGIGTTSPNDLLELLSTGDAQLRLAYDTSNYHALQVASDGGLTWSGLGTDADLNFDFSGATDGDFSINSDDLFVDTSSGRVGIGTTGPSYALDVVGAGYFSSNLSSNGNLQVNGTSTLGDANTDTTSIRGLTTLNDSSSTYPLRFGADVNLYRGSSDRLDLATGDSLNIVSGQYTQISPATTGTAMTVNPNSLTSGTGISIGSTGTAFSSGKLLSLSKTGSSGSTAFTGDIANFTYTQTFNGGVGLNSTGNALDVSRAITLNNSGNTHTISGALVRFSDSATQTAGTLTSSADVVSITQNYVSNSGSALNVTTAGSGLALRVNDDGTLTDSTPFVVDGSGNVGIGTTSPSANLSMGAQVDAQSILLYESGNARYGAGIQASELRLFSGGSTTDITFGYIATTDGSTYTENVRFTGEGNVGIGTTSPNDLLELLSTSDAQLRLAYDTSNYHALQVASDGGLTWSGLGTDADLNFDFSGATDGDFSINSDDLFVDTSGSNVGIGTTSPSERLHLAGDNKNFKLSSAYATTNSIIFANTADRMEIYRPASSNDLRIKSRNGGIDDIITFDYDAGYIGIGTTSPNDQLEILSTADAQLRLAYDTSNYHAMQVASDGGIIWSALGTDADIAIDFSGATDGDFSVNSDDLFVDTSTGRVGIGGTNPTVALSVVGNGQFSAVTSGTYSADLNLTSSGVLTTASSDIRLKENLADISGPESLSRILQLKTYNFDWKENGKHDIGLIAQDVASIIPEIVFTNQTDGYMGINYSRLPVVLVSAVQEQQNQINNLSLTLNKDGGIRTLSSSITAQASQIQTLQTDVETLDEIRTDVKGIQSELNSQTQNIAQIESVLENPETATQSAVLSAFDERIRFIESILATDTSIASESATVLEAVSDDTTLALQGSELVQVGSYPSFDVEGNLSVLGNSSLGDTLITGDLLVNAEIQITRNEINTFTQELFLQRGKVQIDTAGNINIQGNLTANEIEAETLALKGDKSLGTGVIPLGQTTVFIENVFIEESSKLFLSPRSPVAIAVSKIESGKGFEVTLTGTSDTDITFDWLMILDR